MKHISHFILGLLILLTISCVNNKKDEKQTSENKVTRFADNDLKNIFEKISQPIQEFSIDNSRDTIITGEDGTALIIPKNIFCDTIGNVITNTKIELVEAFTLFDMLRNGLSTVSESKPLETDGMIYINARSKSNNNLQLVKGKEIYVETPSLNSASDIETFNGNYKENNIINWNSPKPTNKYLTTLPLKYLNFYPSDYEIKKSNYCGISKNLVRILYSKKFENTLISTKEFETRMQYIHKSCNDELLKLYLTNINLNMWEIDSIAFDMLAKQNNKQATSFKIFKNQKKTKVKSLKIKDDIYLSYIAKTFDNNEQTKKRKFLRNITTNSFSTTTLGWINCDRFMNEPKAVSIKLQVIAANIAKSQICKTYLVFQSYNSIIELKRNNNGVFYIGDDKENKMILPKGDTVLIVSLSSNEKTPFFAIQNLTLGESEQVKIILNKVTPEEIVSKLKEYNRVQKSELLSQANEKSCCDNCDTIMKWRGVKKMK